jgi:uncharacterized membrane protein
MRFLRRILLSAAVLLPAMTLVAGRATGQTASGIRPQRPRLQYMRGAHSAAPAAAAPVQGPPNMVYNGGAVLPNSVTYAIWWGKPSDFPPDARDGIDDFLEDLDGSDYLRIADQYLFGQKAHTRFGGNFFDSSAPTSTPVDAQGNDLIYPEVFKVLDENGLKPDPTAVYFVFTSNYPAQAAASGFCAFHTNDTSPDGTVIHLAYVPNSTSVPSFCGTDFDPLFKPNIHSEGTRAIVSDTAHEFMETITDPNIDAWYNLTTGEIGDPCAYIFQTWVPLRDSRWKIQEIWSNQANGCVPGAGREGRVLGAYSNITAVRTFDIPAATYGTFAQSVNAEGAMAGYYNDANNIFHSFVRDKDGTLTAFDPPVGVNGSTAYGINGDGEVAGYYFDVNFVRHGFVRDKHGTFATFDATSAMSGTSAYGINEDGAIAGKYRDANLVNHGFVRDKHGAITTFDAPGAGAGLTEGTWPLAINAEGSVTGYYLDANSVNHGFVRDKHSIITTFDAPGAGSAPGAGTFAYAINEDGAIVGHYTDAAFKNHSYVRDKHGLITEFDAPNAVYGTFAYSINSDGAVAGYYSDANGFPRGYVRDKHGNFTKIDTPGKSYGTVILSINDEGAVAGYYTAPTP